MSQIKTLIFFFIYLLSKSGTKLSFFYLCMPITVSFFYLQGTLQVISNDIGTTNLWDRNFLLQFLSFYLI